MRKAFTLIEFLIALVIIGFIVAILVGVFSSPVKQARTDSAVTQVKDSLRQLADAGKAYEAQRGNCCTGTYAADPVALVAAGKISAIPTVPAGVQTAPSDYSYYCVYPGGRNSSATPPLCTYQVQLSDVTEAFCKDYNAALHPELGVGQIVKDCAAQDATYTCDEGDLAAFNPAKQCGTSCCYQETGTGKYHINMTTGILDDGNW